MATMAVATPGASGVKRIRKSPLAPGATLAGQAAAAKRPAPAPANDTPPMASSATPELVMVNTRSTGSASSGTFPK